MVFGRLVRDLRDLKRFEHILLVLLKYQFGHFLKKTKLKRELPLKKRLQGKKFEKREESKPERMRAVFEELGGTFIKLGQLLSLRPDLVPKEFCDEFAKLQDNVAPFPASQARKIIETELKKPIESLFSSFDPEPIAAASIGQVHKAILKTGRKVVVKVRRPGIRTLINTDIDIMYYMAHLMEKHYKDLLFNPTEIVQEFEDYTKNELNYVIEAKNVEKFCRNFSESKIIRIPKVYWSHTTERVLTLEYIDGKKIDEIEKGYNKKKVIENLVNAIFKQIFIDGFFHADPHPGNIFVLKNNVIALLDFGIVGSLDKDSKENMTRFFISLIQGDLDGIANGLINLGFVDHTIDTERFKDDLRNNLREYYNTPLKYVNISSLFPRVIEVAKRNKLKLPSEFVLLGKSLMTTEGFCVELNPDFNLVEASKPFVKMMIRMKRRPKYAIERFRSGASDLKEFAMSLPRHTRQILRGIQSTHVSFRAIDSDLQKLVTNIERVGNKVALGIIIAALIIGATLIINLNVPTKILGIPFYSFIGFIVALFLILLMMSNLVPYRRR